MKSRYCASEREKCFYFKELPSKVTYRPVLPVPRSRKLIKNSLPSIFDSQSV